MQKHTVFIAVVTATVLAAAAWTAALALQSSDAPAAVLLACRGSVTVVRGGEMVKGTFGMALASGDEVRTGKDSQAEVHFDNGQWVQIGANSSTQIHGTKGALSSSGASMGEKSFEVVQNFLKLKDSEGTSSLARLRSGEKRAALRADSPMQTKVRENRPTFHWSVSDPSMELRLTIYSDKGIHWKRDVPKGTTSLEYPADAAALVPGVTYSWVLETTDPLVFPPLRSEAAFFEILSDEERQSLDATLAGVDANAKPSDTTVHVVRASLFFDHGLMDDAIAETTKALAGDPDNAELHAILARLYAETGRTQEALDAYNRLLEQR